MNLTTLPLFQRISSACRGLFLSSLVWILPTKTHGQCKVYKDEQQRLLTSCEFYNASGKSATGAYRQELYLGSPYLTYPVWQAGSVQVKKGDKPLPCEVAYNLVNREIMCRFQGDSTVIVMTPEEFVINDVEYIRQPNHSYATLLYDGPTKLTMIQSRKMEAANNYPFSKDKDIIGIYKTNTTYYIQKGSEQIELTNPSKRSIVALLVDQKEKLKTKLPAAFTPSNLVDLLAYYDSLTKDVIKDKQ